MENKETKGNMFSILLALAALIGSVSASGCYGNILNVPTTGASARTAQQDRLSYSGVKASEQMAQIDLRRMDKYKARIIAAATKHCVDPAVIAGVISRESRAGNVLINGWGDHGNALGLMQVDKRYHTPRGAWDSEEHISQGAEILVNMIKNIGKKFPSWNPEERLKGGIAAYNAGTGNIISLDVDVRTTGKDYSNDVVGRAKKFKQLGSPKASNSWNLQANLYKSTTQSTLELEQEFNKQSGSTEYESLCKKLNDNIERFKRDIKDRKQKKFLRDKTDFQTNRIFRKFPTSIPSQRNSDISSSDYDNSDIDEHSIHSSRGRRPDINHESVLRKSLSFVPTSRSDKFTHIKDINLFARKLALQKFFKNKEEKDHMKLGMNKEDIDTFKLLMSLLEENASAEEEDSHLTSIKPLLFIMSGRYGNIMNIPAKGASSQTAQQDRLPYSGVQASEAMAKTDLNNLERHKPKIKAVASRHGVDPALVAGIMSRETRGGGFHSDGWGDHGNAFGLMQVDKRYHAPCGAWDSEEHIEQGTKILRDMTETIGNKFPHWTPEQRLKGGIAAYNMGPGNIHNDDVDRNTTGGDYSNDVLARAQFFKRHGY
ncbi:uncharacterized protein O3C94_002943 [Discoglossus pictus]